MTKIITLFNQSGGVGKTSLTMNLGYHLHELKHKVLLVDMDPQSSLTCFMGVDPTNLEQTVYHAICQQQPLPIHFSIHGMDLVPTNITLSLAEMELVNATLRDFRLKDALADVQKDYDYILIDCLPSLGILSYISLMASTHVLIPVQTQYKSLFGTQWLLKTIFDLRKKPNPQLQIAGFVPNLYDGRNSQDTFILKEMQEQLTEYGQVFPAVPRTTAFADASQFHKPLALHSPRNGAVSVLKKIARLLEKI